MLKNNKHSSVHVSHFDNSLFYYAKSKQLKKSSENSNKKELIADGTFKNVYDACGVNKSIVQLQFKKKNDDILNADNNRLAQVCSNRVVKIPEDRTQPSYLLQSSHFVKSSLYHDRNVIYMEQGVFCLSKWAKKPERLISLSRRSVWFNSDEDRKWLAEQYLLFVYQLNMLYAQALAEGRIYTDIKPENMLLVPDYQTGFYRIELIDTAPFLLNQEVKLGLENDGLFRCSLAHTPKLFQDYVNYDNYLYCFIELKSNINELSFQVKANADELADKTCGRINKLVTRLNNLFQRFSFLLNDQVAHEIPECYSNNCKFIKMLYEKMEAFKTLQKKEWPTTIIFDDVEFTEIRENRKIINQARIDYRKDNPALFFKAAISTTLTRVMENYDDKRRFTDRSHDESYYITSIQSKCNQLLNNTYQRYQANLKNSGYEENQGVNENNSSNSTNLVNELFNDIDDIDQESIDFAEEQNHDQHVVTDQFEGTSFVKETKKKFHQQMFNWQQDVKNNGHFFVVEKDVSKFLTHTKDQEIAILWQQFKGQFEMFIELNNGGENLEFVNKHSNDNSPLYIDYDNGERHNDDTVLMMLLAMIVKLNKLKISLEKRKSWWSLNRPIKKMMAILDNIQTELFSFICKNYKPIVKRHLGFKLALGQIVLAGQGDRITALETPTKALYKATNDFNPLTDFKHSIFNHNKPKISPIVTNDNIKRQKLR